MLRWAEKFEVAIPPELTEYAARLKKRASVRAALTNEGLT
jgi:hypothetical protein